MFAHWVPAYVGLGSNQDNPIDHLRRAITELGELAATRLVSVSRMYKSKPWGVEEQPAFINAVAGILTRVEPSQLLSELKVLEKSHGRDPDGMRWGPRTLDLDLLLFGHRILDLPDLVVPHPRMCDRNFVIYPLGEIAPSIQIGKLGSVRSLMAGLGDAGLEVLG